MRLPSGSHRSIRVLGLLVVLAACLQAGESVSDTPRAARPAVRVASLAPVPIAPLPPGLDSPECIDHRATMPATAAAPPQTRRLAALRRQIGEVLGAYERRPLNTIEHTPWEVMHWAIAYGAAGRVLLGGENGDPISGIGWLNSGGRSKGQVMLAVDGDRLIALRGKGMQGHFAQYLAVLAQCRVAKSALISVDGAEFTVADLVASEQRACSERAELTFALIAMAHHLPTDKTWKSGDGTEWSLPKLVQEELRQPLRGAPCGGTHRLFGLAYACQRRREQTGTIDGAYVAADHTVRMNQQRLFTELQNPDGSFSTEWFHRPEDEDDVERKLRTSGHMLEFLVSTADQPVLYHPKTIAAVEFVTGILRAEPTRKWATGPMCHALHALSIYQERAWGALTSEAVAAYHGRMKAMSQGQGSGPARIERISLRPFR